MDKATVKLMKESMELAWRNLPLKNGELCVAACHAYAALCQAEALERIAGCHICSSHTNVHDGTQHDWYERDMKDDANNRGDQSIADAISERPILCLDCNDMIPPAGVYAFNDPNDGQVIPLCGSCGRKRDKESIADAINEQVTDPPDEPWSTLPQRTYKDGISFVCFCNVGYASKAEADECTIRHAAVPPDVPFEPIRALCIGCDMLYPIEDLTTRSTGRFCTTCYYLEVV